MDIQQISIEEFKTGRGAVGTTPTQISTHKLRVVKSVTIKASLKNKSIVCVGYGSNLTSTNGYVLEPGQQITIEIDELNKVWVVGGEANQDYSWLAM